jgi:hypothetical protein
VQWKEGTLMFIRRIKPKYKGEGEKKKGNVEEGEKLRYI